MSHRVFCLSIVMLLASEARADTAHDWSQGQPPVRIAGKAADQFCYLTRVKGSFSGTGEKVRLAVVDGQWQLSGSSQQSGVAASARCIARTEIKAPVGSVRLSSEEMPLFLHMSDDSPCRMLTAKAWWGDAVTHVTSILGRLRGGGEFAQVQQSDNPFGPSLVQAHTCQDAPQIGGAGYSFFVGKPQSGKLARFIGPKGIGTASQAGEYVSNGGPIVLMAPRADAICMFSYVGGKFSMPDIQAAIFPTTDANGVERWAMGTHFFVTARARCYSKQQG